MHGLFALFFGFISLFSTFFVSAILLTLFMDTYVEGTGKNLILTPAQRRKWSALTLVHVLWTRTICSPADVFSSGEHVALKGSVKAAIEAMDTDGDGLIDKEEFLAAGFTEADFALLDGACW